MSLEIINKPEDETISIEGVVYSYEFFKCVGKDLFINEPFIVTERKGGVVTIEKYNGGKK